MSSDFWSIVQGICALIGAAVLILGAWLFIISQPRTRTGKNQIRRNAIILIVGASLILLISGGIYYIPNYMQPHTQKNTPTTVVLTYTPTAISIIHQTTPTSQPTSTALYLADYSQGSQGWLNNSPSSQWTYNDTSKVLESDGSMPCCTPISELGGIVLNAPTTFTTSNYTIKARIKVIGNNPYDKAQPPFFGVFFRGYGLNGNGYMAGIIRSEPNDSSTGSRSFILVQEPGSLLTRDDETHYELDNQWHTYWLIARD